MKIDDKVMTYDGKTGVIIKIPYESGSSSRTKKRGIEIFDCLVRHDVYRNSMNFFNKKLPDYSFERAYNKKDLYIKL